MKTSGALASCDGVTPEDMATFNATYVRPHKYPMLRDALDKCLGSKTHEEIMAILAQLEAKPKIPDCLVAAVAAYSKKIKGAEVVADEVAGVVAEEDEVAEEEDAADEEEEEDDEVAEEEDDKVSSLIADLTRERDGLRKSEKRYNICSSPSNPSGHLMTVTKTN